MTRIANCTVYLSLWEILSVILNWIIFNAFEGSLLFKLFHNIFWIALSVNSKFHASYRQPFHFTINPMSVIFHENHRLSFHSFRLPWVIHFSAQLVSIQTIGGNLCYNLIKSQGLCSRTTKDLFLVLLSFWSIHFFCAFCLFCPFMRSQSIWRQLFTYFTTLLNRVVCKFYIQIHESRQYLILFHVHNEHFFSTLSDSGNVPFLVSCTFGKFWVQFTGNENQFSILHNKLFILPISQHLWIELSVTSESNFMVKRFHFHHELFIFLHTFRWFMIYVFFNIYLRFHQKSSLCCSYFLFLVLARSFQGSFFAYFITFLNRVEF